MGRQFAKIAFTPLVKKQQELHGSRRQYQRIEEIGEPGNQKHSKSLKYTRYEVSEPSLKQRVQSFDDRLNHHMLIQAE
jgi:hypothetical protein